MWLAGKEKRWETNPSKNVANPVSEISKFVDEIFVASNFMYLQDGPPLPPIIPRIVYHFISQALV
jgi:hypothetical protein